MTTCHLGVMIRLLKRTTSRVIRCYRNSQFSAMVSLAIKGISSCENGQRLLINTIMEIYLTWTAKKQRYTLSVFIWNVKTCTVRLMAILHDSLFSLPHATCSLTLFWRVLSPFLRINTLCRWYYYDPIHHHSPSVINYLNNSCPTIMI